MAKDLTEGKITDTLIRLAMPIMATSIIQMAYNMTDLIWIGRLGSNAVAAIGTAGFFPWFGFAFILISKVGAEITVSQSLGKKDRPAAREFARTALYLVSIFAVLWMMILIFFTEDLIAFFNIDDPEVNRQAVDYLRIIAAGTLFNFLTMTFTGIYNGCGDSKTPFIITTAVLALNIILDPILIFGWLGFDAMGVTGAAIATIISQFISAAAFLFLFITHRSPFPDFNFFKTPHIQYFRKIIKMGSPVALESAGFTVFAVILARIVAKWGAMPIAVQRIGAQIEAISWMSASGFATALAAVVGQNFGAEKWERIWYSYRSAFLIVLGIGSFATFLFLVFPEQIFSAFLSEKEGIALGAVYLRILGVSQIFMCIEIISSGAFKGMGRTVPPTVVSFTLTGLRIPLALLLSESVSLGVRGVWWSLSITSIFKGIILVIWFIMFLNTHPCILPYIKIGSRVLTWNSRYLRDKRSFTGKC